jgi:hypothetical protein
MVSSEANELEEVVSAEEDEFEEGIGTDSVLLEDGVTDILLLGPGDVGKGGVGLMNGVVEGKKEIVVVFAKGGM